MRLDIHAAARAHVVVGKLADQEIGVFIGEEIHKTGISQPGNFAQAGADLISIPLKRGPHVVGGLEIQPEGHVVLAPLHPGGLQVICEMGNLVVAGPVFAAALGGNAVPGSRQGDGKSYSQA